MICWSFGGGIQSVAIGVLIRTGRLPVPDLAVIADTGRERRTTWEYLRDQMQPYLDSIGLTIQIAGHDLARVDLCDRSGLTLVPAFTEEGRLSAFCSGEWKRDVIERWLRLQGITECTSWIGFSIDEVWRVSKKDHRKWCRLEFPLIDLFINRAMCRQIIEDAGLPLPSKSRCYGCPHQNNEEWQEVRDDPVDWPKAVEMERQINASDPEQSNLFLYKGRVPLELATFSTSPDTTGSRPCEAGNCFT